MKKLFSTLFFAFVGTQALFAQDSLRVEDVLDFAKSHNPRLKTYLQPIESAKAYKRGTWAAFNTNYSFSTDYASTQSPYTYEIRNGLFGYTPLRGSKSNIFTYSASAYKRFTSGTILQPSLGLTNYGKNSLYETLLDAGYGKMKTNRASVSLYAEQPLLLGAGSRFNKTFIRIADINVSAAEARFVYNASLEFYSLLQLYLSYIHAYNNLLIQKETEALYDKAVSDLSQMAELDAIPKADLLFIKATATNQKSFRVIAENRLVSAKNQLIAQMGGNDSLMKELPYPKSAFPATEISMPQREIYVPEMLEKAKANRGDYLALGKNIAASEEELGYHEKRLKPQLNLTGSVGYNGIGEGPGPMQYFSPYYSNIPGPSFSVGLKFDIAPAFDAVKSDISSTEANLNSLHNQLQQTSNELEMNIKRYYDQLAYYADVVKFAKEAVRLNRQAVENEFLKLKLETSTVINVVQTQNNYANSLAGYNSALLEFNMALLSFRFFTGTLLSVDPETYALELETNQLFNLPN